jgi:hypothetical protein
MLVMMPIMAISHPGERRFKPLLADACFGRRVSIPSAVKHIARAQIDKDGRRACLRGRPRKVGNGARDVRPCFEQRWA